MSSIPHFVLGVEGRTATCVDVDGRRVLVIREGTSVEGDEVTPLTNTLASQASEAFIILATRRELSKRRAASEV